MIRGVSLVQPTSAEEALRVRADLAAQGRPIAGGTDVLIELRRRRASGVTLIDLTRIQDWRDIRVEDGNVVIGALCTHEQIARHPLVRTHATALAEACSEVGSLQIRNRGTIGGNVANASPCADGLTALVALDARAEVASVRGVRRALVSDLVERPYRTTLQPDELIVAFQVPVQREGRSAFVKLGRRDALAIARINAGCVLEVAEDRIVRCLLAVGSVMPRTQRVVEAEQALEGAPATEEAAYEAGSIVAERMVAVSGVRWSTPYKEPAVRAVVARVLLRAMGKWHDLV